MPSLKQRVTDTVDRLRERYGWLDHTLKMLSHYGSVNGNAQAGAVTYFGFLSIFPILAIAFFVVGKVAQLYPDIKPQMVSELSDLLPGIIGGKGGIPIKTIEDAAGKVGLIGLVALVYAGLGWLPRLVRRSRCCSPYPVVSSRACCSASSETSARWSWSASC